MRLFAKFELKIATPMELQELLDMEKELSVADIKWFRTITRRYLQMLRHEEEREDDSQVKKDTWKLVRKHLGDFATKDLDTAPSSGGWLSMLSWGGGATKKEDPRWEETADEVAYVLGWQNGEDAPSTESAQSRERNGNQPSEASGVSVSKPSLDVIDRISSEVSRPSSAASNRDKKERLPESPQSYATVAAKPFSFGIEHISPRPSNADTLLLVDIRLLKGSLTLRRGQHQGPNSNKLLAAISFNGFRPIFRIFNQPNEPNAPPTWEFESTLAKLIVTDESNPLSKFKKIVQAPRPAGNTDGSASIIDLDDVNIPPNFDDPEVWDNPLLFLNAAQLAPKTGYNMRVEIRLEESLIFYHRQFVEEIVRFFKPPDKHETLNALFDAMMEATKEYASETIDNLRTAEAPLTRSALEFAITETQANIIQLDLKAPLIICPEKYYFSDIL
jgi:Repeating coiled region of VPS13